MPGQSYIGRGRWFARGKREMNAERGRDREYEREGDRAPIDSDGIIHILGAERPGGLFVARAVRTRNKGYRKLVYSLMAADRIIRYIRPGFRLANVSFNFILPRCNEGRQNSHPRYTRIIARLMHWDYHVAGPVFIWNNKTR